VNTLNIGFIGVGSMALEHAEVASVLGHRIFAATCTNINSQNWINFKAIYNDCVYIDAINSILLNNDIDVYIVCLPWNVIDKYIEILIRNKKPMLIEKPVSIYYDKLYRILSKYDTYIGNKMVGFNRRFYKSVLALKDRVKIGGLKFAEITISEDLSSLNQKFGDKIFDHILEYSSCHILDISFFILNNFNILNIFSYKENNFNFKSYNGLLQSDSIPVSISINANDPVQVGLKLKFDDNTLWHLSPIENLNVYQGYNIIEPTSFKRIRQYFPKKVSFIESDCLYRPGIYEQMKAFTNSEYSSGASLFDFLKILNFIHKINMCSKSSYL